MFKQVMIFAKAIFLLAFVSCQTAPVRMANISEGNWRAKTLVKDRDQGRSFIVNLNVNAIRNAKVRLDVTNALGLGVASLTADTSEVRYLLFDSKRMYYGQSQPDVMRPILAIPFDPRWLHNLLFDEPFAEKSWTCVSESGWVKACSDSVTGLHVKWMSRSGDKKTILIEHAKASLQINVLSFRPKVEDRKNLFLIEAPQGFQRFKVR